MYLGVFGQKSLNPLIATRGCRVPPVGRPSALKGRGGVAPTYQAFSVLPTASRADKSAEEGKAAVIARVVISFSI